MESKPVISYAGDETLFASLQSGITQQLSVDHVEWRRSFGRAAKTVYVEASFVKFTESIIPKENEWKLIGETFFHTYWTDCVDVDQYKATVRDDIANWLGILKHYGVHDWLIVVVEAMDGKKGNKAKLLPRASVMDKIKNDFCNKQQDRCLSLLDPLKSDSRGAESWQALLLRIRQLLLQAYNRHLGRFEEHMRSQRERRNEPGWSFCEYFILQEELAFIFEMLGVYDEALVQYDELDALFTQFVLNSKVGDTPEWLRNFYRTCNSWMGLTLAKPLNDKKQQLIREGKSSLLDIRNYLFSRQCSLLLLLYRPWEVAQRTLPFLHNCINELQILEVTLPLGAVSCWVFLSCLEILQTCEKFHDSTQVEAYSLYTAGLWAYARDKLRELGVLCGLMPGMKETSEQLQLIVGLLSGLAEEELNGEKDEMTPIRKVKEALSSREAFQHRYLELSELAMGTFKHIGRIRSARLIGKDLAHFYMKLGEPQKAAVFLTDMLKTCLLENWAVLSANTRLDLATCYRLIEDHDKICAQIASSSCLPEDVRLNHFEQMVSSAETFIPENRVVRVWASDIFNTHSISVDCDSEMIICDSCVVITLVIISHLVRDLSCGDVIISVACETSTKGDQPATTRHFVGGGNRWKSWDQMFDVHLSEQFDYQQDRSLTSVSLVCPNVHTVLRRRDSQFGFHKEKEITADDCSEKLVYGNVVLHPGRNELIYKCRAKDPGFYTVTKIAIKANHMEFVVPKVQPSVGYEVVFQAPKLYFQRTNKSDLVAGAEQELVLVIHTGSCIIEKDMVVKLIGSEGLLLRVKSDGDDNTAPYMQTVESHLPIIEPFKTIAININVIAETQVFKEASSFERKVAIVNPWTMEEHQAVLLFVAPFSTCYKLHTTNNRKYIQVIVQGLQSQAFEISGHSLNVNCSEIALVPSNPLSQKLVVCKHQNISYLWEMVSNLLDYPPLHFEFQMNYQHKPASGNPTDQRPNTYKYRFNLENYKTLYAVRSKVEPVGSEFCRVGSICHMNVTISAANSNIALSSLPSLMYEVIADQMTWAVCGRSAGIVSLGVEGSHNTSLDVMPLTRGFLPLPAVRVSKYVTMDQKTTKGSKIEASAIGNSPSYGPNYPRLEPFSPGQVYNWSKATQVHVLPALGTSSTDSLT